MGSIIGIVAAVTGICIFLCIKYRGAIISSNDRMDFEEERQNYFQCNSKR
jgi:hypothetical protein